VKLNFSNFINILFPVTEDEKIILTCTKDAFCRKLGSRYVHDVSILLAFSDNTVRSAIHLNKFHAHPHARKLLSSVLETWLTGLPSKLYILIPIPLSSKRERERGYNQVTIVALDAVRTLPHITLTTHVLTKNKHTPPQTSLTKQGRAKNLKGVFSVSPEQGAYIKNKDIILLDDVTTTGATLHEAKAALLPHSPASIVCIALAH